MPKPNDLQALASNAMKEIERHEDRLAAMAGKTRRRAPWLQIGSGLLVVGLTALGLGDNRTKRFWFGVSEQKQLVEVTATLTAARLAVDSSRTTTGEWPKQVPLPALAALVELQGPGPDYRLVARTSRTRLTMTPTGEVQRTQP